MIYKVEITETLCRIVEIEASDRDDALAKVESQYRASEIVLDEGDYTGVDFSVIESRQTEVGDLKKSFIDYCRREIDLPDIVRGHILGLMDKQRCPLSSASPYIASRICDLADDFEKDNNLSDDWFSETFDDEEEIFMKL